MKAKVYFSTEITPENVVKLYHALGIALPGKVAVKVHSGEKGNQNFLHPEFWKPMVEEVRGTVVECNTAYGDASTGVRDNTESHLKLLEEHGWTKYQDVEDAFVGAYKKIEDAFVDRFLEKVEPEQGTSGEVACPKEGAEDRENRAASDPRSSL